MRGMDDIDAYEVLGLSPRADDVVIRAAWKALIRKYHPDTSAAPDAAERSARINAAFKLLVSAEARAAYDRSRAPQPPPVRPPPPRPAARPAAAAPRRGRPPVRRRRPGRKLALIGMAIALVGTPIFLAARHADALALPAPLQRTMDGIATNPTVARMGANARYLLGLDAPPVLVSSSPPATATLGPPPPLDRAAIIATVDRFGRDTAAAVAEGRRCAAEAESAPAWAALDSCAALHIAGFAAASGMFGTPDPEATYFEVAAPLLPEHYAAIAADGATVTARLEAIRKIVWSAMLRQAEARIREQRQPEAGELP